MPAAFSNLVGLKPTRGLLSTSGVVPACRSVDCVSIFARTCKEARTVFSTTRGFDKDDPFPASADQQPVLLHGLQGHSDSECRVATRCSSSETNTLKSSTTRHSRN